LEKFSWESLDHSSYSSELACTNFHLLPEVKEFLGSRWMVTDKEGKERVMD
jgi:hypothetical protein